MSPQFGPVMFFRMPWITPMPEIVDGGPVHHPTPAETHLYGTPMTLDSLRPQVLRPFTLDETTELLPIEDDVDYMTPEEASDLDIVFEIRVPTDLL